MFSFSQYQDEINLGGIDVNFSEGGDGSGDLTRSLKLFEEPEMPFVHKELDQELSPFLSQISGSDMKNSFDCFVDAFDHTSVFKPSRPENQSLESAKATQGSQMPLRSQSTCETGSVTLAFAHLKPTFKALPRDLKYCGSGSNSRSKVQKATFADRRDVVYKCLVKAVRTTLLEQFKAHTNGCTFSSSTKGCRLFQQKVVDFLKENPHFGNCVNLVYGEGEENYQRFWTIFAVFLENGYYYPGKSPEIKKAALALRKCTSSSSFTIPSYTKLFSFACIQEFFRYLSESGFIENLLLTRGNMEKSSQRYRQAVESIIKFGQCPRLMD